MTAYEMRISDWSSDVCSSDLRDDSPTHIGSTDLADSAFATFFPAARNASFSQGCKPDSLYDDEAFGTPHGLSLQFLQAGIRYSGVGDRKSAWKGHGVSVSVVAGGGRDLKKKKKENKYE